MQCTNFVCYRHRRTGSNHPCAGLYDRPRLQAHRFRSPCIADTRAPESAVEHGSDAMLCDRRGAGEAGVIASRPRNKSIALEAYETIERGTGHNPRPHQQGESRRDGTHQTYPTAIVNSNCNVGNFPDEPFVRLQAQLYQTLQGLQHDLRPDH